MGRMNTASPQPQPHRRPPLALAIIWDQDSAANSEIFIDGIANSATDTGTIREYRRSLECPHAPHGQSDNGNPFDGKLDEVRVYNAVSTAEKVKNLYDLAVRTR